MIAADTSGSCGSTLGTYPEGSVRFGLGPFTSDTEIDAALEAVASADASAAAAMAWARAAS